MATAFEALTGNGSVEPAAPAAPAAPVEAPAWVAGAEPEVANWVATKGYKSPADVAKAYYHLEKLFGADKAERAVVVPGDQADPTQWEQVYKRLGRPERPEGYGLKAGEGGSQEFADRLATWAHQAGLSPRQAQALHQAWNGRQAEVAGADMRAQQDFQAQNAREFEQLERSYGAEKDQKFELARRAARTLGWDKDTIELVEGQIGTVALMKSMVTIGEMLREDAGVGSTAGGAVGLPGTPDGAKAAIQARREDREFMAKLSQGDVPATREWRELHKRAQEA